MARNWIKLKRQSLGTQQVWIVVIRLAFEISDQIQTNKPASVMIKGKSLMINICCVLSPFTISFRAVNSRHFYVNRHQLLAQAVFIVFQKCQSLPSKMRTLCIDYRHCQCPLLKCIYGC